MHPPHLVGMTLAFILAAVDPPDDVGAPHRYADSPEARRARDEALSVAERDGVWVTGMQSGGGAESHQAFTAVMHAYGDRLVRFAYGFVRSADAAEDIVQNVFIRIWDGRNTLRPSESLRAYLFMAVRRSALNVLKRRTVEARYVSQTIHESPGWQTPAVDEQTDADDTVHEIRGAMARLTERRRTALRLRYEERLPFVVVAQIMGVSEKSAKHLVTRAVDEVRGYLGL
jgi:RNA polymerase sigma-70 factor (ECF subfamily)